MTADFSADEIRHAISGMTTMTAPPNAWAEILRRTAAAEVVLLPQEHPTDVGSTSTASARPMRRVAIAAGIFLCVAGAAAALLSSRILDDEETVNASPAAHAPAATSAPPPDPVELVMAGSTRMAIHIDASGPGLSLHIRDGSGSDAAIRATGFAAAAQFRSGAGILRITNARQGAITVTLPAGAMQVWIDGVLWIEKRGDAINIRAPGVDTVHSEFRMDVPPSAANRSTGQPATEEPAR